MKFIIDIDDETADALLDKLEARKAKRDEKLGRPLKASEFAKKANMSTDSVYRRINTGVIKKVPKMGKLILIPASELERFTKT